MSDSNNPISALNHLPSDLIEAILPFLPPKSLCRFKSVSKRWYSLISSPEFIKAHVRDYTNNKPNSNPTHLILFTENDVSPYSLDIKQLNTQPIPATPTAKRLNFQEPLYEIHGSCNGLLLATDVDDNLCLFNPTTPKTLKVLGGESNDEATYGFGYDSSTDDYKVVSISRMGVSDSDPDTKFVRLYSLRNNSWNMLPNFSYKHGYYGSGVLLNNNLHWLVRSRQSTLTIATFSLASEKFHEIEFPDSVGYIQFGGRYSNLYALGGKLVVVECDEFKYELWVMEEYGVPKSWKKLYTFENDMDLYSELFAQVSNREILLGNNWANEIVIYNMDERRCTGVTVGGHREGLHVYGTYVESLESFERFPLAVKRKKKKNKKTLKRFR